MDKFCKRLYKVLGYIFNFFLILIIIIAIIAVYYLIQTEILNKDYANIFGYTAFEVATGSMSNTIEIGDIVIVKITEDVCQNDIIVYQNEDEIITHRLLRIEEEGMITKGDANNKEDSPIQKEQVIGKVEKIITGVAIIKQVLKTPEIIISIVVVIILIGIIFLLDNSKKKKEQSEGE